MPYDITESLKGKINDTDIDIAVQLFGKQVRLNKIHYEIAAKYSCKSCINKDCLTSVPIIPKATAEIMFIGLKPTSIEGTNHLPYIDSGGAMFQIILNKLGKNPNDMYMTYLQKCCSDKNGVYECMASYIEREIKCLQPKLIVLMGVECTDTFAHFFELDSKNIKELSPFKVKVLDREYPVLSVSDPNKIGEMIGARANGIKNKFWQHMNAVFVYFDKLKDNN